MYAMDQEEEEAQLQQALAMSMAQALASDIPAAGASSWSQDVSM